MARTTPAQKPRGRNRMIFLTVLPWRTSLIGSIITVSGHLHVRGKVTSRLGPGFERISNILTRAEPNAWRTKIWVCGQPAQALQVTLLAAGSKDRQRALEVVIGTLSACSIKPRALLAVLARPRS